MTMTQVRGFFAPLDSAKLKNIINIPQALSEPKAPKAAGTRARSFFFHKLVAR